MNDERLQEIKGGKYLLHGTEEWTNQEDAETEVVILELIAAVEELQAENERLREGFSELSDVCRCYSEHVHILA